MTPSSPAEAREKALLARLQRLVRDQSQAKLARSTGRSRTALTRYMQGAKIPLEFGTALVQEFGVNPAWLHTGEEPVYLADVPETSAALGNDLLEMVRAIDNVSGLKLGALSGRSHARALRDISDTLHRYGSLRDRLNRMVGPALADLVTQTQEAVDAGKLERARVLDRTAAKLERFSDDPDLARRLMVARAFIYQRDMASKEAIELRKRLFQTAFTAEADFRQIAEPAHGLVQALRAGQFCLRARRIARIAMSFAEDHERKLGLYVQLLGEDVMANVELGDFEGLAEAVEEMVDASPADDRLYADTVKLYYSLHHGVWSPREIAGADPPGAAAATMLLNVCYITDDADVIDRALRRAKEHMNPEFILHRYHIGRAEDVIAALRGKAVPEKPIEERLAGTAGRNLGFPGHVNRAHVLRLAGDRRAAKHMLEAQTALEGHPADVAPLPVMVALHLRNVISGIARTTRNRAHRELRSKAVELCKQRVAKGYGLLREVLRDV